MPEDDFWRHIDVMGGRVDEDAVERPSAEADPDWRPRVVIVDGEDRDAPEEAEQPTHDGGWESVTMYFPPRYLPMGTFVAASEAVDAIVTDAGGLPDSFDGRPLLCVIEVGTTRREPAVGPARHDLLDEDVIRSSVWVSHESASKWPKSDRLAVITSLAARAALDALPGDHGAHDKLRALADLHPLP
jgi:hypothetical protein